MAAASRGWTKKHSLGATGLALLFAMCAASLFMKFGRDHGWLVALGMIASTTTFTLLIGNAYPTEMRPAMRRHNKRMAFATFAYVAALLAATRAYHTGMTEGPIGYLIALAPAIPALVMFGSMFQVLREEKDEFCRMQIAEAVVWAAGLTFSEALIWGFLETFGKVPHVWMWVVTVAFLIQYGVAASIIGRRYR